MPGPARFWRSKSSSLSPDWPEPELGSSRMPSKSSRSVPFSQSSRSVVPNSAASTPAGSSTLSLVERPSASVSVDVLTVSVALADVLAARDPSGDGA